jgi:hypothetical protein
MKTRLMVLGSGEVRNDGFAGFARLETYRDAMGDIGNFRGVFSVPRNAAVYQWWEAATEGAALRKARIWLKSVGAVEIAR